MNIAQHESDTLSYEDFESVNQLASLGFHQDNDLMRPITYRHLQITDTVQLCRLDSGELKALALYRSRLWRPGN